MRKGKEVITQIVEKSFYWCDKLSHSLAIHGWLLVLKNVQIILVLRRPAFLLALQRVVDKTVLIWPSPKVIVPRSNIPTVQEAGHERLFFWDGASNYILKWLHFLVTVILGV